MTTYQEKNVTKSRRIKKNASRDQSKPEWHPTVAFHRARLLCVSAAVVAHLSYRCFGSGPVSIGRQCRERIRQAPIVTSSEQPNSNRRGKS